MRVIHHLFNLFRSQGGSNQVALAAGLGLFAGLLPPLFSYIMLWACLLLVLRVSFSAFITSTTLIKFASIYGIPSLAYKLGYYLLEGHGPSITNFWQQFCSLPFIAFLELRHYQILGSWVIAAILFLPVYVAVLKLHKSRFFTNLREKESLKKLEKKFFGEEEFKGSSIIRGRLLVYIAIFVIFAMSLFSLIGGLIIKKGLESGGKYALGVPIQVQEVTCNWWQGRLLFHSLVVGSPDEEKQQIFSAELVEIDIGLHDFFRGQLSLDALGLKNAVIHISESKEGQFNFESLIFLEQDYKYLDDALKLTTGEIEFDPTLQKLLTAENLDWSGKLCKWAVKWQRIQKYKSWLRLQKINEYGEKLQGNDKQEVLDALLNIPTLEEIEQVLQYSPGQIKLIAGRAKYIKDQTYIACHKIYGENVQIRLKSEDKTQNIACNFHAGIVEPSRGAKSPIEGKFNIDDIPLAQLSPFYPSTSPLMFKQGKMNINTTFSYQIENENVTGQCLVGFQDVHAEGNNYFRFPGFSEGLTGWATKLAIEGFSEWLNEKRTVTIPIQIENSSVDFNKDWKQQDEMMGAIENKITEGSEKKMDNMFGNITTSLFGTKEKDEKNK